MIMDHWILPSPPRLILLLIKNLLISTLNIFQNSATRFLGQRNQQNNSSLDQSDKVSPYSETMHSGPRFSHNISIRLRLMSTDQALQANPSILRIIPTNFLWTAFNDNIFRETRLTNLYMVFLMWSLRHLAIVLKCPYFYIRLLNYLS